jgi:hypothetical protein
LGFGWFDTDAIIKRAGVSLRTKPTSLVGNIHQLRSRSQIIPGTTNAGQVKTYLIKAKWQAAPTGVADLHTFHGKLERKAAWTRGLFVSNSGFTEDGLVAFGRGKRVECMDGLDLFDTLSRELPLNCVLESKVRRAAETGLPFARVRDLFP